MCKWIGTLMLIAISAAINAQTANEIRDPTTPLGFIGNVASDAGPPTMQLNSVLISAQRKLAIINGSSVREGQSIPGTGIKVARILPQKVVLQQGEKTWSISLSPGVLNRR